MSRLLAAAALGVLAFVPVAQAADPVPTPFGQCDGVVDVFCRVGPCPELDCGLVPPCVLWTVATECVL